MCRSCSRAPAATVLAIVLVVGGGRAEAQGGGVIIRIPDGSQSRCINAAQDRLWLTLRREIVDKKGGWLKEDTTVSVLVTAQMRVAESRPVSFPLMADANVKAYSKGQVSVPVEYTFIDGLALKQGTTTYSGATINMTIFNQRSKTNWGSALTALSEVAKKLPLPSGPVTQSVTYLMDFAMSALDKDASKVSLDDKAKSATMSLTFDPSGACASGDFEQTGTLAILQDPATSPPPDGAIRVADVNNYCWSAELTPSFVLKAAKKESGFACTDAAHYRDAYHQVMNNYIGLVMNAVKVSTVLGRGAAQGDDEKNARRRCDVNGIPQDICLQRQ
jgi:hypothetical protein